MTGVALVALRHGPTDWNEAGLIQGHRDRPLSPAGRRQVAGWRLPAELAGYRWVSSALTRARETAALLGHPEAEAAPALAEMHWGDWEGCSLAELRAADPAGLAANEARGLDLRPPGGESPRELRTRLRPWLAEAARAERPTVAVCHKGVIRALLALACDWDLTGAPPAKLREACLHRFRLDRAGHPSVERLNEPLLP